MTDSTEIIAAESELRRRMQAIARAEMTRRRAGLGLISKEQEHALDHLVSSMVERISTPIVEKARLCYASGEIEKARKWCSIFN
jgi:hypothetical protein